MTAAARARLLIAGLLVIFGLGRLGLFSYASRTALPAPLYGWLMLGLALALTLTAGRWRLRARGRIVAGFGVCALGGLATDIWLTGGSVTSALILIWLAVGLLGEALGDHDC